MTQAEYAALPAFYQAVPKDVLERQYAKNAEGLRQMLAKAEHTGKKYRGYTADELRLLVNRFATLSQPR